MSETEHVVESLARAYSLGELLSADDPRLRDEAEVALSGLAEPLRIEVGPGRLRVRGEPVPDGSGATVELARDLERAGVRAVEVAPETTVERLVGFFEGLRGRASGVHGSGPATALSGSGVSVEESSRARPGAAAAGLAELFDAEGSTADPVALAERLIEATGERREALAGELRAVAAAARRSGTLDRLALAVERLAEEGRGGDPGAARLATELVGPAVGARLAARLVEAAEEDVRTERLDAVAALGRSMAEVLADLLAETAERAPRRVWEDALVALGSEARPVARDMLADDRWFVVRNGTRILGRIGNEDDVPSLRPVLTHDDARVRRELVMALGRIGGEEVGPLLVAGLDDPDPDVRTAAATAVGALRVSEAGRSLRDRLGEEEVEKVRIRVLRALGALEDPAAVPDLEKHARGGFFSRPASAVRIAAYRALARIGTPRARSLVEEARDDRDPEVRRAVRSLLDEGSG